MKSHDGARIMQSTSFWLWRAAQMPGHASECWQLSFTAFAQALSHPTTVATSVVGPASRAGVCPASRVDVVGLAGVVAHWRMAVPPKRTASMAIERRMEKL